ncbi:MAG TPA: hypothetical protein VH418_19565 [Solirubrobacteraceae bacterium]
MIPLAMSVALGKSLALLAIFLGIGLIVNVLVVIIAIGVVGEHRQNVQRRLGRR